ncbi:MAG: hypothetical protein IJ209_04125 [Bacteroidaceae bacterium]|nr:hypothetical protein [Bacteroidaceae bacterium]
MHVSKALLKIHRTLLGTLCLVVALCLPSVVQADVQRRDSTAQRSLNGTIRLQPERELPDLRHRMLTSAQPVEIRQQGRYLCVTSRHAQLLPVYSASGTLYSSFRLTKGTNWLNGLPRGQYFINNRKFTIN